MQIYCCIIVLGFFNLTLCGYLPQIVGHIRALVQNRPPLEKCANNHLQILSSNLTYKGRKLMVAWVREIDQICLIFQESSSDSKAKHVGARHASPAQKCPHFTRWKRAHLLPIGPGTLQNCSEHSYWAGIARSRDHKPACNRFGIKLWWYITR